MNRRYPLLAALVLLALIPAGYTKTPKTKFANCPVTIPRATLQPLRNGLGTPYMYRNGNLYAGSLWPDATVMIGPRGLGSILPDGSLWMKYPWFRAAGLTGTLHITGRRLDAPAPPLGVDINPSGSGDIGFQATGLIYPTEGCWVITGNVAGTTLTFVNRVIRAE